MRQFVMVYKDGEPQVHRHGCRALDAEPYCDPFEAEDWQAATVVAADIYAGDLDCFDGRYDTVVEAREESLGCVVVMGCVLECGLQ